MFTHGKRLTWNNCSMTSVNAPRNPRLPLSHSAPRHRYRWLQLRTSACGVDGEKILNSDKILPRTNCDCELVTSSAVFHAMRHILFCFFFFKYIITNPKIITQILSSLFSFGVQWRIVKALCSGWFYRLARSVNILVDKPTANSSRHSVLGQGATDPRVAPNVSDWLMMNNTKRPWDKTAKPVSFNY